MRKILALVVLALLMAPRAYAASTIVPNLMPLGITPNAGLINQNFQHAINDVNAQQVCNWGTTAPSNPSAGYCWWSIPQNGTVATLEKFDGTVWVPIGTLDTVNHIWTPFGGGGTVTGGTVAANNTALKALSTASISYVTRLGFAAAGDSPPPLGFIPSTAACSLNSGAGDGASQVPSSNGKCWLGQFGPVINSTWFGASTTNSDNSGFFASADAAGAAQGGALITIPAGDFAVATMPTLSGLNQWALQPGALLTGGAALSTQLAMFGGYLAGPSTLNPYAYDTIASMSPLSQNVLYSVQGSITVNNPVPHGILTSGGAAVFSSGGNVDNTNDVSECYLGLSSISQINNTWLDAGGVTVCEINNAEPPLNQQGTFSATAFFPTVPFAPAALPGGLPPKDVLIITDDTPVPFVGFSTHTVLNGSGLVTEIDVSGWYPSGSTTTGTPTGHTAFINFGGDQFARNTKNLMVKLNGMTVTTNGTANVTLAGTDLSLVSKYQMIGDGGVDIPLNAVITSINSTTGAVTIDPPATGTETAATATISARPFNLGQVAEEDARNHSGFNFDPTIYPMTMTATNNSNIITGVSDIADVRIGMTCVGTGIDVTVIGMNRGSNSFYITAPFAGSTVTGAVNCYWGYQFGGAGLIVSAQDSIGASAFNARGENAIAFIAQGASDTSFLVGRQTGSDAHPKWGFRSDRTFTGPSQCDFALTNMETTSIDANTWWCVNPFEQIFNKSGAVLPTAPTSSFVLQLAGPTATVINTLGWGQGSYFEPSAAGGTPSSPTALTSGAVIGGISLSGYDGSTWSYSAGSFQGMADGSWAPGSHPTSFSVSTVPSGATAPVERFLFPQDGTLISIRPVSGPTISSGTTACGISPSATGSVMAGLITVGSGTVGSSCLVTWQTATEQPAHCMLSDRNTNTLIRMTAASTAGFTFAGSFAAADSIDYICGYTN